MRIILTLCILLIAAPALAAITFVDGKWESSFDLPEWTQGEGAPPGEFSSGGSWTCDGLGGQITTDAKNPLSKGARGFRHWQGDGTNKNSGGIMAYFPSPQKELWIRWYHRYEKGFQWSVQSSGNREPAYDKLLYIWTAKSGNAILPEPYYNRFRLATQSPSAHWTSPSGKGWKYIMGSDQSDGRFHVHEIYIKMDTNGTDGIGRYWINGELLIDSTNMNYSGGTDSSEDQTARNGWTRFLIGSNQKAPDNGQCMYVDYDDFVIYNKRPPNVDANGNPFIGPIGYSGTADGGGSDEPSADEPTTNDPVTEEEPIAGLLFEENFEDGNFSQRGWYDNISPVLSSSETTPESTRSLELHFPSGATKPVSGGAMRKKFDETDSVYISYNVKYSDNWQGSNRSYHPHEFNLLTNKDTDWSGLAYTYLTAYIEQNQLHPRLAIQDGKNIDLNNINQNLVGETEIRGIAGCNGTIDDGGDDSCYAAGGGLYNNGKFWSANSPLITVGKWHKVEAYFKLNSISNGIGVADGILQYRLNGQLIINQSNVIFRTGEHADMKFKQFIIAPWIGDGSPVDQTFWVDNLTVATTMPDGSEMDNGNGLGIPTNLRVISSSE